MGDGKRRGFFKIRISRVVPSFNLCRSNIKSNKPDPPILPGQPRPSSDDFAWGQDDTWHVVAKARSREQNESPPRRKIYTPGCDNLASSSVFAGETEKKLIKRSGHVRQRQRRCLALAVVKRSDDPHADFKRSMFEMILEKQMFHETELQQLLRCFLSLNSERHYPTILRAFSDVCDTLFSKNQ